MDKSDTSKNDIIKSIYYDLGSLGSMRRTYEDAHAKDKSIKLADVKNWYDNNIEQGKYRGTNSYIAPRRQFEYQMDICFFNDLKDPDYNQALVIIDIFTKFAAMTPIKSKMPMYMKLSLN